MPVASQEEEKEEKTTMLRELANIILFFLSVILWWLGDKAEALRIWLVVPRGYAVQNDLESMDEDDWYFIEKPKERSIH